MESVLEARAVSRFYPLPRRSLFGGRERLQAVQNVSLQVHAGEVLGIVGESGSGKSTLARMLMALEPTDTGEIRWLGQNMSTLNQPQIAPYRRHIQMVFQDPFGSLDPRMRILDSVAEPLDVAAPQLDQDARRARVLSILERVGLGEDSLTRYPHQFSGGQRQRIAIARALALNPKLLVADEAVSALDVSIQAQILNLLVDLRAEFGLSLVFISHDLGIVRYLADRVVVMKNGVVVEEGATQTVFETPQHDYTRRLLHAMLKL